MSAVIATMMWEISGSLRCRTVLSRTCCRSVYVFMLCSCLLEADGSCLLSSASQLPYASAVHQSTYIIIIKAKIHYTSFLVASLQQVGDFPTTSPQHKWQVRNKSAACPSTGKLRGNECNGFWAIPNTSTAYPVVSPHGYVFSDLCRLHTIRMRWRRLCNIRGTFDDEGIIPQAQVRAVIRPVQHQTVWQTDLHYIL